ncbi:MAG: hypothetical protein Q4G22_09960 [Paracoccus sp. (in: a-proteobacteria)]|uniref:hypothetical protein n=1 Tax=Paracoccus sp. TaxID=267 RepID=UPI0026DFA21B|nr:hypothetical protein [Paracoccus sp. (in: a-proteobacteria)]MDO5632149.1 hypothetical protein [Paracoccus sp. (in: a-proteobacteria)]
MPQFTRRMVLSPQGQPYQMAGARSFALAPDAEVIETALGEHHSLHHIDLDRARVCWVDAGRKISDREGAFFYQEQRRNAQSVLFAPFDDAVQLDAPLARRPVLFFSIGRCGSTLISKIAHTCGLTTWSEPDSFTNLTRARDLRLSQPQTVARLTHLALSDLDRLSEGTAFGIKFRAEVTGSMASIIDVAEDAISFFVVRDAVEWARSSRRVFGVDEQKSARRLARMVQAARQAIAAGRDVRILDYRLMVSQPEMVAAMICDATGLPYPDAARLQQTMQTDSQQGTTINREASRFDLTEGFDDRFRKELAAIAPAMDPHDSASWFG